MIKQMERVFIHMLMELNIMVSGRMISSMDLELRAGLMVQSTRVIILKGRKMD